jgi:outer membrane protein
MKKTLIYIALIFAVSCQNKPSETAVVAVGSVGEITIAMIDTDSIFANYDMADDMRRELEAAEKRLTEDLQRQARSLQTDYQKLEADFENYQRIGHTLTLSEQRQREEQFQKRGEQMQRRQGEMQQLEQRYMQQLMELQAQKNGELQEKIFSFIEEYNKNNENFSIIMSNSRSAGVLYSLPSMDITAPVLEAMNTEYARIRKKK